jgi:hypothetical protein
LSCRWNPACVAPGLDWRTSPELKLDGADDHVPRCKARAHSAMAGPTSSFDPIAISPWRRPDVTAWFDFDCGDDAAKRIQLASIPIQGSCDK